MEFDVRAGSHSDLAGQSQQIRALGVGQSLTAQVEFEPVTLRIRSPDDQTVPQNRLALPLKQDVLSFIQAPSDTCYSQTLLASQVLLLQQLEPMIRRNSYDFFIRLGVVPAAGEVCRVEIDKFSETVAEVTSTGGGPSH
jgi:hypothetical protein